MNINKKIILVIFILLPFFSYAEDEDIIEDSNNAIIQFDEKWAINVSGMYSNISFRERSGNYTAESPWAVSIGLNYKGISMSMAMPILYRYDKNLFDTFNIQLTSYNDLMYYDAFCKRYRGFGKTELRDSALTGEDVSRNINLDIFFTGLSIGWLLNGKNHSLSAAYELDRKQLVSSDSFILGFGIYYLSITSDDEKIARHNIDQSLLYFGPNFGYSYTFVFSQDSFLNLNLVVGLDAGVDTDTGKWLFIPQIMPKIAFGQHFNTWSFNIAASNIVTVILWSYDTVDILMPSTIALTFSKRF